MGTATSGHHRGPTSHASPSLPLCHGLTLGHCVSLNGTSFLATGAEFGHIEDWLSMNVRF